MPRKTFEIGVKGILIRDNRVLLLKAVDNGEGQYWDFPGGGVENNETLEKALIREVTEEVPSLTNIQPKKIIHASRLALRDRQPIGLLLVFFEITAGSEDIVLGKEHQSYKWVSKDDLASLEANPSVRLSAETEKAALMKAFKLDA